jgi:hypothetical protein
MANRKFKDRDGRDWEVRDRSSSEWILEPILDNPSRPRRVKPPRNEEDPFELTDQELQRLLDDNPDSGPPPPKKSPFLD